MVLLGATAPAVAHPVPAARADCPFINTVCLYEGEHYAGVRLTLSSWPPGSGVCISLAEHGWSGRARSAYNTNPASAALFLNDDCLGGPDQLPPGGTPILNGSTLGSIWVP
ncbi:peptidase inhibitor family I36 protein [Actinoplanes sp. NBC_00393]|uniref:peptidase inhibitor family I36 protein n=1 Tax=Actinoplanes sp. NBC_00393 TaxID=2975953 RepID=UPI002E1D85FE